MPKNTSTAQEIFTTELKIRAESLERKNKDLKYNKPIEDFHILDTANQIFIIMDGATRYVKEGSAYPNPSHASYAASAVSHAVHTELKSLIFSNLPANEILHASAESANAVMQKYNSANFPKIDYLENDFANACGIIAFIKHGKFYFAYLGDPQGYLIRDRKINLFTNTQTETIEELYLTYAEEENRGIVDFRKYVCGEVRNKPLHMHAFGSFTGEEGAMSMLEYGEIQLKPGDRIILTSDGLLPLFKRIPELILSEDYNLLFDEMEKIESNYNVRSDDKTLIAIDIK